MNFIGRFPVIYKYALNIQYDQKADQEILS